MSNIRYIPNKLHLNALVPFLASYPRPWLQIQMSTYWVSSLN